MKRLIMINGTMGVGKTTVCRNLKKLLPACVFLDGDWCWDMDPFVVNEESKAMVLDNIAYLLSSFLKCSLYENVLFCWVMQEQEIIDEVLGRLTAGEYEPFIFTLTCSEESLLLRLEKDIRAGIRTEDVTARSLDRLPLYSRMSTEKIDTTGLGAAETAQMILAKLES